MDSVKTAVSRDSCQLLLAMDKKPMEYTAVGHTYQLVHAVALRHQFGPTVDKLLQG